MEKEPIIRTKQEKFELPDQAKETIRLFQAAKVEKDPEKQTQLLRNFHDSLIAHLILPQRMKFDKIYYSDKQLREIILIRDDSGGDSINFGTGSSGERIYFLNQLFWGSEDLRKYAPDFSDEELKKGIKSRDGKPRWMFYRQPSQSDGPYAQQNWERFMQNFGDYIVDLEQKME